MQYAIEADGLGRRFGAIWAVEDLTLAIAPGEVFGVLGPNGAGKTTTVRLLNGVLAPTAGRTRVLGLDPVTAGPQVRAQTGVLTETPSLYERLSARDNLRIYGALYGVPAGRLSARVEEMLAFFGLAVRAADRAGTFSKGMKQRLALARALLHEPPVLFLDEPTAGLDPEAAQQVTVLIEQLSHDGGRTVFLCTHNLPEAQRLCDRVAVISQGRILALGTPAELAARLWHGHWIDFELREPPPRALLPTLRALPAVVDVTGSDTSLAVRVREEAEIPDVVAAAAGQGARIMRANPREHSLEEIYFALQHGAPGAEPVPAGAAAAPPPAQKLQEVRRR